MPQLTAEEKAKIKQPGFPMAVTVDVGAKAC